MIRNEAVAEIQLRFSIPFIVGSYHEYLVAGAGGRAVLHRAGKGGSRSPRTYGCGGRSWNCSESEVTEMYLYFYIMLAITSSSHAPVDGQHACVWPALTAVPRRRGRGSVQTGARPAGSGGLSGGDIEWLPAETFPPTWGAGR
jgi:hypothetical protein